MLRRRVVLAFALVAASCNHYQHGERSGTLAEVAKPELVVYVVEGTPIVSVSNVAADGACLVMNGLTAKIDGVAQPLRFPGNRNDGTVKGHIGTIDKSDFCSSASFNVTRTSDTSKKTNVVEVSDGPTTLRAELPNIFSTPGFSTPPPSVAHPASTIHAVIAPPPPLGTAKYDAENWLVGSMKMRGMSTDVKVPVHPDASGNVAIDVPGSLAPGSYVLYLASSERGIAAISCSFASCTGANEFVVEAPITVTP